MRGSDYHGDSAIDDVLIRDKPCPEPLLKCDFDESPMCSFIQVSQFIQVGANNHLFISMVDSNIHSLPQSISISFGYYKICVKRLSQSAWS